MKNKKLSSLTIAIPAYNEEKGLGRILKMLLQQNYSGVDLKKIIVYSDGSTDKTVAITQKMQERYPVIRLKYSKTQKGKNFRLNQIFKENTSDLLVVLDADIGLVGKNFIQDLIEPFYHDKKAIMIVAHQIPLQPKDFIGKVLHASFLLWDYVRLSVPNKDHVQNFYGAATAYRKSFAKKLQIPEEATEERLYIYLMAKKTDGFRYNDDAVIVYWAIGTIHDYLKLADRSFGTEQPAIEKLFGKKIHTSYEISRKYVYIGMAKSFYHQPLYTPLAVAAGFVLSRMTQKKPVRKSALWEIATSTKKPIQYEKIA